MFARRAWNASVLLQDEISRYIFWLGKQTSTSYVFAAANPVSHVQSTMVRYGNSRRFKIDSAFSVSDSSSSQDCSGVVIFTSSTLSNRCCRMRPRPSAPYEPASDLRHGVCAV